MRNQFTTNTALWGLLALAFFVGPNLARGQFVSVGVKGGIPLTDALNGSGGGTYSASTYRRDYIIGPEVEIHLPFHLSFEAEALYRRNGYTLYFEGFGAGTPDYLPPSSNRVSVNDWQFPLLAKYEMRRRVIFAPFADGGVVYRHVSASSNGPQPDNANTTGIAVGGGLSVKLLFLRLSPEVRYTRWFTAPYNNGSTYYVLSNKDQADLLLGVTF